MSPISPIDVSSLMPGLLDDLAQLVALPSCAFPGYPAEPVLAAAAATIELLKRSGLENARLLEVPGGYPAVFASVDATHDPANAPTVLLYAHYDVQPAPPEQGWSTDPWTATTKDDGRIYGRGAADDKGGIIVHAGTLQALRSDLPVNVKVLIEGEEETNSHLEVFVAANPELVQADVVIVADCGNVTPGVPAVTVGLRGAAVCEVTVRTLDRAPHSGLFGGAAPDALTALIQMLATLHDENGSVKVPGLHGFEWSGAVIEETAVRRDAGVLDRVSLIGVGAVASRLWSQPSITIIGMDVTPCRDAAMVVTPEAKAIVSLRVPPGADAHVELQKLITHLRAVTPWGAHVEIEPERVGQPFAADPENPTIRLALEAMSEAFGTPAGPRGEGGSIPLAAALEKATGATAVLWGVEDDEFSRIHASDESVDPQEIKRLIDTQVRFIRKLGRKHR